jgi:tetratricopeptide (TPR) repeat protein
VSITYHEAVGFVSKGRSSAPGSDEKTAFPMNRLSSDTRSHRGEERIMKLCALCLVWLCIVLPRQAAAVYTVEPGSDEPLSQAFRTALSEIDRMNGAKEEAGLLAMLEKFKQPHEQLEIKYQLAILYNQRTGMVCHEKAVMYFEDVLEHELPPRAVALARCLCGDSRRIMKDYDKALEHYLKGLAFCLEQDLPDVPPEVPGVGIVVQDVRHPDDPAAKAAREEHAEQVQAAAKAKLDRDMIRYRDTLIQQIVTLYDTLPFDNREFRALAEPIIRDGIELDRLVYRVKAHLEGKERERKEGDSGSSD